MPVFQYRAARDDGEVIEGELSAADTRAAAILLQAEGRVPIHIFEGGAAPAESGLPARRWSGRKRLNARDVEMFTLKLATLLSSGLPLARALDTLVRLTDKPAMAEVVTAINQDVRGGAKLSEALASRGQLFDRFYLNMVRAGESTGALDMALERLAVFRASARALRESLVSSLIYPAILVLLAMVSVAVMVGFVVPQFTEMFAEAGQQLPLLTRIVAGTGALVARWWWLLLAAAFASGWWLRRDWREPAGRRKWDARMLRVPVVGSLVTRMETARLTRTLATLLQNGVGLLAAMDIGREIVTNRVIAQALERVVQRVRQGEGLAPSLADTGLFPVLATQLVQLGEETGRLEHMLAQVADIYEGEVQTELKRLLTLAEPVIIIVVAALVTVIILSVILMILESNNLPF